MATGGVMADFARLPASRKALIFVAIAGVLGLLYRQFIYKSLKEDVDDSEALVTSKAQAQKAAEDQLKDYQTQQEKYAENIKKIRRNQRALPTEAELPAFLDTLNQKIRQAGVELHGFSPQTELPIESFVKVPVQVEISGTFMQIKRFFASLSQEDITPSGKPKEKTDQDEHDRIVSIESLTIGQPVVKNREIVLTAKFTATTFRQQEQALKPGQGSGSGSAAPSTAPQLPAPPAPPEKLPSAATPAGAKVRAQGAIDSADQKTRAGQGVNEAKTPAAGSGSARLKDGL